MDQKYHGVSEAGFLRELHTDECGNLVEGIMTNILHPLEEIGRY